MKITAPYRGRRPTKRLDLTDMRSLFADRRVWCVIGRVVVPPGEPSHFDADASDVHVEVQSQPRLQDLTCRLAAGVWTVPKVGEEVLVAIPEGEIDFMPVIMHVLSTGSVPTVQGPAEDRIAIIRDEVVVHDGSGGAGTLATHQDLLDLKDAINGWTPVANDGGAALKAALTSLFSDGWPHGTTVLKGK